MTVAIADMGRNNRPVIGQSARITRLAQGELASITSRMSRIEQEMARSNASEGDGVSFNTMGFQSNSESNAWLELNALKEQFGFVVDFHTVMEHIRHQITGTDSLLNLGKLYKLKLKIMSESVSITSFEVQSPRFFTSSDAHSVVDSEASYFHILRHNVICKVE